MDEKTRPDSGQSIQDEVVSGVSKPEEDQVDKKDLVEILKEKPIMLIPKEHQFTIESVKALAPNQSILLCDAYIKGVEDAERVSTGFIKEGILSIDHHMPIEEMNRQISSTNLAIDYVREKGPVPDETVTIINHTDCDSILSSAIMRGILEPKDEFGEAAIATDHTGEPNRIGDLLQSIEDKRDIEFSLRNLQLLLEGKPFESEAEECLQKRLRDRERARDIVEKDFTANSSGEIYYASLDKKIDSGLLPAFVPKVKIIVIFNPMVNKETKEKNPQHIRS